MSTCARSLWGLVISALLLTATPAAAARPTAAPTPGKPGGVLNLLQREDTPLGTRP